MKNIPKEEKPMKIFSFITEEKELFRFRIHAAEKQMSAGKLLRELIKSYNKSYEQD